MTQTTLFEICERPTAEPELPPHNGTATSIEAAESMKDHVSRLRATVLDAIRGAGERGLTTDEAEILTGLSHQSCSPRVGELAKAGYIRVATDAEGVSRRRPTRSGRGAQVYVTT